MVDFLTACINLDPLAIIKAGGYLGLLFIVFAESGLLVGIFFPGDSLLFAAGLLAANGFLDPVTTVIGVILAAIIGDNVGYWFGKNVGVNLFSRPNSRFFKQEYVTKTQKFYSKYGARAVILARFVPIVRTLAPILAGIGRMNYEKFLAFNAIGGFLWGGGMVLLGYTLGTIIPSSEKYILPISLVIIAISFLPLVWNFVQGKRAL
ncbi:MAG: VTT domain-containing protein [bacterium]|nr:VTT domain-containing protein [bacterium]